MYRLGNHKKRKPDFLMVIFAVVGVAMAATLTLHVHALSVTTDPAKEMIAAKVRR